MNFIVNFSNWLFNPVLILVSSYIPTYQSYVAAESEIDNSNIDEYGMDQAH